MNFDDLRRTEDALMSETLTGAGFCRVGAGTWNRREGHELNVIQLQQHSANASFCVNLGIHYAFLPKPGTESPVLGGPIEAPDCELKLRLTGQDTVKDQWWPIVASSVDEVAGLVYEQALPIFDSYRLDGPISTIDAKRIESGTDELLRSLTKVRSCLLLARIHEHLGNRDAGIAVATLGLRIAGRAVGPKKALTEILKRFGATGSG